MPVDEDTNRPTELEIGGPALTRKYDSGIPRETYVLKEFDQARQVVFGDIVVVEDRENHLSDEEFKQYQERFELYKSILSSCNDINQRKFLSSSLVFGNVMGLSPEVKMYDWESVMLYQALKRTDSLDQFLIFKGDDTGLYHFFHKDASAMCLKQNRQFLGIDNFENDLKVEEISERILTLYNKPDKLQRDKANGIFSGFPQEAVKLHSEHPEKVSLMPSIKRLNIQNIRYLESVKNMQTADVQVIQAFFSETLLQFRNINQSKTIDHNTLHIFGFGLSGYETSNPPSESDLQLCQRMLEIDRRLGVSQFMEYNRRIISAKEELSNLQTNPAQS